MKAFTMWFLVSAVLGVLALFFIGCSGGGGSPENPGPSPSDVRLSGMVSKGSISGAAITVYAIDASGSKGSVLGSATSDANGAYSIDISSFSGNIIIEATGGTYTDEATGSTTDNTTKFRAAVTGASGTVRAAVTPFTEIAVEKAGVLTTANIDSANTVVSNMVGGGTNIISTMPANVLVSSSSGTAEKNYGLALAAISQMVSSGTSSSVSGAITNIVIDLADNKLDTTGAAISAALATFIASGSNQTGLDSTTAPVVASITDATSNTIGSTILKGTYHHIDQSVGFFGTGASNANSMSYGDAVTIVLDGYGNGTANGIGMNYDMLPDTNTINSTPNPISNLTITYTTGSGGSMTLAGSPGWVSVDGNVMISSEASVNGTLRQTEQRVELRGGTGMSNGSLNGTYAVVTQLVGFVAGTVPTSFLYGNNGNLTFNGTGSYTSSLTGWLYTMDHIANTISLSPDPPENGTYSVASDGSLVLSADSCGGWISADGNVFMTGGNWIGAGGYSGSEQTIGVKLGTNMNNASLNGTFKVAQQSAGFFLYSGASGTVAGSTTAEYVDTITFDGAGNCSWLSGPNTEYDMSQNNITTSGGPGGGVTACTYSVSSNGTTTITIQGFNLTAWLSANGNTFIWGGGGWDNTSIAGGAVPILNASPVWCEQAIGVKVLGSSSSTPPTVTVSGVAKDKVTGLGVPSVTVTVRAGDGSNLVVYTTTTDSSGAYTVNIPANATGYLHFEKTGYAPKNTGIETVNATVTGYNVNLFDESLAVSIVKALGQCGSATAWSDPCIQGQAWFVLGVTTSTGADAAGVTVSASPAGPTVMYNDGVGNYTGSATVVRTANLGMSSAAGYNASGGIYTLTATNGATSVSATLNLIPGELGGYTYKGF